MSDKSSLISKLLSSIDARTAYIKAKLGVLVPSQIRSLRLSSNMPRQSDLAKEAGLHQSRISMFETPGAANMTIETLSRLAAAFKVGLIVEFVAMSDMLLWENRFSQDSFRVTKLNEDVDFIDPGQNRKSPNAINPPPAEAAFHRKLPPRSDASVNQAASLSRKQGSSLFDSLGPIAANSGRSAGAA